MHFKFLIVGLLVHLYLVHGLEILYLRIFICHRFCLIIGLLLGLNVILILIVGIGMGANSKPCQILS